MRTKKQIKFCEPSIERTPTKRFFKLISKCSYNSSLLKIEDPVLLREIILKRRLKCISIIVFQAKANPKAKSLYTIEKIRLLPMIDELTFRYFPREISLYMSECKFSSIQEQKNRLMQILESLRQNTLSRIEEECSHLGEKELAQLLKQLKMPRTIRLKKRKYKVPKILLPIEEQCEFQQYFVFPKLNSIVSFKDTDSKLIEFCRIVNKLKDVETYVYFYSRRNKLKFVCKVDRFVTPLQSIDSIRIKKKSGRLLRFALRYKRIWSTTIQK